MNNLNGNKILSASLLLTALGLNVYHLKNSRPLGQEQKKRRDAVALSSLLVGMTVIAVVVAK